jgi:XRE family transcriptional regulator, regulator of sulfur utilization
MKKDTGSKIRKVRELKSVSQNHIAKFLGISQAAYSCIESGKTKISDEKLSKISIALEVPKEIIINFDVEVALNACSNNPISVLS